MCDDNDDKPKVRPCGPEEGLFCLSGTGPITDIKKLEVHDRLHVPEPTYTMSCDLACWLTGCKITYEPCEIVMFDFDDAYYVKELIEFFNGSRISGFLDELQALRLVLRHTYAMHKFDVRFKYKNHRGEISVRHVAPYDIAYKNTEWHPKNQWFLDAKDLDKENVDRSFAILDILEWLDE